LRQTSESGLPPADGQGAPRAPSEHGRSPRPPGRSLRVRVPPGPRELCERQHIHRLAGSEATLGAVMSPTDMAAPRAPPLANFGPKYLPPLPPIGSGKRPMGWKGGRGTRPSRRGLAHLGGLRATVAAGGVCVGSVGFSGRGGCRYQESILISAAPRGPRHGVPWGRPSWSTPQGLYHAPTATPAFGRLADHTPPGKSQNDPGDDSEGYPAIGF